MSRLSRVKLPRWALLIAVVAFIAMEWLFGYFAFLNYRLSRELAHGNWREPTVIVSAAGGRESEVMRLYGVDWRSTPPVSLDSLPRYVSEAFIAAEDVRFRHHLGVDPIGIVRALIANVRGHAIVQGGSTIDQQIIKSRFLSSERTWRRKFVELLLATILEARLSKNEILELYLNEVYLGHSGGSPVLGVDEASRLYFAKPAERLRLDEAALLASIIRAPNRDNPQKRPDLVRARRDAILRVMRDHKWVDEHDYQNAVSHGVNFAGGVIPQPPFPFYLRALRAEIVKRLGVRSVIEGGLTVICEMDPSAQHA